MSIAIPQTPPTSSRHARLLKYMARPQRHRLLHGYPLAAAMPYANRDVRNRAAAGGDQWTLPRDPASALLIGVLPHPFCNPKLSGCGYCTFPHETFSAIKSTAVARAVVDEITQRLARQPDLHGGRVAGLYFGGGTANLTPRKSFRQLAGTFAEEFDLSEAEVTLEGVPARFLYGIPLLMDVMTEQLPARHFRISMGIQTFDEHRLQAMGRLGFGRPTTFAAVVKAAHSRGMTVSGDLLFNLPEQHRSEMLGDARRAIEIGLDQICLYHLVMFRGLGTPWSRDESLLDALPSTEQAVENWLALREYLLDNGYRQTSLTNFERHDLAADPRRYQYEPISYQSDRCQVLGFGPSGISYSPSLDRQYALKTINPESSAEYVQAVHSKGTVWNRYFQYQPHDLEILHFTRRLASLRIEKESFTHEFGPTVWTRHQESFDLCVEAGLLAESPQAYSVTPHGMFFSDSIAALLAESRFETLQPRTLIPVGNNNSLGHM